MTVYYTTLDEIEEGLSTILPDKKYRKNCLSVFAESIVEANSYGRNRWGVYCFRDGARIGVRLLVGHLIVFTIDRDGMWLSLDKTLLDESKDMRHLFDRREDWQWGRGEYSEYQVVRSRNGYYIPSSTDFDLWPFIRQFHFAYIKRCAQRYDRLDPRSQQHHSPALLAYIRKELGQKIPGPEYGAETGDTIFQEMEEFQRRYRELPETERASLVLSRIGQGVFRSDLKNYWKTCAVTGCAETELLVASHIKPWRDSDNFERLDVYNGLLLVPQIDRAFDRGYVSFDDGGKIIISRNLSDGDRKKLGIYPGMRLRTVEKNHRPYLEYHRQKIFIT
ncbi:HNH endonuclease [Methanofollis formosanus]|nr:HNH endonuclease [Methanofollis formosanus]